ncbi:MAG: lipopolysaccharide biosynthesis protein RfbH [Limisphaerales bacterium]
MPDVVPGRLFEIAWPYTDLSGSKTRPAVAMTGADALGDVEFLMVSTKGDHADARPLQPEDFTDVRLPRPSFVRLGRPLKLRLDRARPLVQQLTADALNRIRREGLRRATRSYAEAVHPAFSPAHEADERTFHPGTTTVPYAGRVFDADEVEAAVAATLDFWLTLGPEGDAFEGELAKLLGVRRSILVNSGSSANLVAFAALTSAKLGERRIAPGDEVITVAAGFPTTVAPILQHGAVPVFVDNDLLTLNARVDQLEAARSPRTKAVMMAHTLGNPFDLAAVKAFCERHGLWLVEDNCDALGSTYDGRLTGTFGDLSTQSFYPPHHLTMGEGGAVNVVRDMRLKVLAESFRDWGRDCWCASGKDNTCNKRFGWQLGELPEGYDHKYIYSHLGYNLKPLDPQAAIGRQQLKKLPGFIAARRGNWQFLRAALAPLEEFLEFQLPTHASGRTPEGFAWDASGHRTDPSWFGFMMRVRPGAPFSRREFVRALDVAKIGNRMLFGGNLVRQPAFVQLKRDQPGAFRVVSDLAGADCIMNEALFIGVYPGLTQAMLDYMAETITRFVRQH